MGIKAEVVPFFSDMAARYAPATLVISRAGGTTLAELACVGCPAILVPYPRAVADHQLRNARTFEARGAAWVVEERVSIEDAGAELAERLRTLLGDSGRRAVMRRAMQSLGRPRAAEAVAMKIREIANRAGSRLPRSRLRRAG
jgi:UDP-N-acetylglucosamine--N-acetylmuramyl-(pentapeptide) pyrophosphoryl-undecaprenol N-acetylglucosamine transferase